GGSDPYAISSHSGILSVSAISCWFETFPFGECKGILGVDIYPDVSDISPKVVKGITCLDHLNTAEGSIAQPYITDHRIGAGTCPHPWEPAVWILRCPTVIHIFLSRSAKAVVGAIHQYRIPFLTV